MPTLQRDPTGSPDLGCLLLWPFTRHIPTLLLPWQTRCFQMLGFTSLSQISPLFCFLCVKTPPVHLICPLWVSADVASSLEQSDGPPSFRWEGAGLPRLRNAGPHGPHLSSISWDLSSFCGVSLLLTPGSWPQSTTHFPCPCPSPQPQGRLTAKTRLE